MERKPPACSPANASYEHGQLYPSKNGPKPPILRISGGCGECVEPPVQTPTVGPGMGERHHLYPKPSGLAVLTTVIILADRQVIGWELSDTMEAKRTSVASLQQALQKCPPGEGLVFHSDQGRQYACEDFTKLLAEKLITQSMSRKGNCWDNAPAESFFKTLKYELDISEPYENYRQTRSALFEFIEIWYNRKRLHSALDYRTPAEAERMIYLNSLSTFLWQFHNISVI